LGDARIPVDHRGFRLLITPWDNLGYHLYYLGAYEPEQTEAFCSVLDRMKPDLFLDIGANLGYYSLLALSRGVKQVVSYEPSPDIADWLEANVRENPQFAGRLKVERVALSDSAGTIRFWLNRYRANLGTGAIAPREDVADNRAVDVRCARGDDYLTSWAGHRIVVKMDIEGAESKALRGMRETLATVRPLIVMELHPAYLGSMGSSSREVLALLEACNYALSRLDGDSWSRISSDSDVPGTCWVLAEPRANDRNIESPS
jgi:FkbM family methyltransferase